MVMDEEEQESMSRSRLTDEAPQTSTRPWWIVRPGELAARYKFDEDDLMDDINPEGLADWQLALAFEAINVCQEGEHRPT
jgi:hypothetical protein